MHWMLFKQTRQSLGQASHVNPFKKYCVLHWKHTPNSEHIKQLAVQGRQEEYTRGAPFLHEVQS